MHAAAEMNPADLLDRQRHDVFDVALHDPLEAVADTDDFDAVHHGPNRRGADDTVDAWGWTAAGKDGEFVGVKHG